MFEEGISTTHVCLKGEQPIFQNCGNCVTLTFISFYFFEVDKKRGFCSYVPSFGEEIRPTQFFLMRESSDSFYLKGDHFKALDLKNDPFYLIRN